MASFEMKFNLADRVVIPMWERVDMHLGKDPAQVQDILSGLSVGERAIHAVHRCAGEVANGGFWQYFGNSTGILAYEAVRGFQLVGALEYAELLEKAIARFPDGTMPLNWKDRCQVMNDMIANGTAQEIAKLDKEERA